MSSHDLVGCKKSLATDVAADAMSTAASSAQDEPPPKRSKLDAKPDDVLPTICVMGATGVGKGSTLNSCFRCTTYSTSQLFASDTIKPASFVLPWRGTGDTMRGVDLCGFSDSEGRDTGFIESMVAYLKEEVQRVNVFLLLLNSQEVRVGMHLKDMLVALKNVFGLPFMQNVMIGFTNSTIASQNSKKIAYLQARYGLN